MSLLLKGRARKVEEKRDDKGKGGFVEIAKRSISLSPFEGKSKSKDISLFEFPESVQSVRLKFLYSYQFQPSQGWLAMEG